MVGGGRRKNFAIGIDLGTSNTVAVIRRPDGHIRPLLFDGQPVMPSLVYFDEGGHLHFGRDAQRMALLDPARCEPNPKRRIDDRSVFLGDQDVPVVELLAAILRAIAAKAHESVGFLPRAVLTHPASWGAPRREVLQTAAARAGFPPVTLVPEPVAAVRYFTDVMRHPVPVGHAVAVFDFGGGTLDVAVVRNDGGSFSVIGSGGLEDLGGLDVDAALAAQLGEMLKTKGHAAIWQQLTAPTNTRTGVTGACSGKTSAVRRRCCRAPPSPLPSYLAWTRRCTSPATSWNASPPRCCNVLLPRPPR